jgi:4-hydroxybenzoate polyprenyltransferase
VLADSAGCTFNDACDILSDSASSERRKRFRPLVVGILSTRFALIQAVVLCILSLIAALFVSFPFAVLIAAELVFAFAYSFPPIRLSGRPYASLLFWPSLGILQYLAVSLAVQRLWTREALIYGVAVFFLMGIGGSLAHYLRDSDSDRATGKYTFATSVASHRAVVLVYLATVIGLAVFQSLQALLPAPPSLFYLMLVLNITWGLIALLLTRKLWASFSKIPALVLDLGSRWVFSICNILTILAVLFAAPV